MQFNVIQCNSIHCNIKLQTSSLVTSLMATPYTAVTIDSVQSLLGSIYGQSPITGNPAAKDFLGDQLNATGIEISYGVMSAGSASPFVHAHKQNSSE
jgi:hypothetical protein